MHTLYSFLPTLLLYNICQSDVRTIFARVTSKTVETTDQSPKTKNCRVGRGWCNCYIDESCPRDEKCRHMLYTGRDLSTEALYCHEQMSVFDTAVNPRPAQF